MSQIQRIAITGAAGQIAYSLLFRIAAGEMLGQNQPIALHLLDVEPSITSLKGVAMELEDCAFPLLREIRIGFRPEEIFEGVDYAILVGAKPRGPGMERKDLLGENGKIFIGQGKALNDVASRNALVFVVGNPCNTNCLIAMHHAPNIPRHHFFAMTRLDQNRGIYQLAHKAGVPIHEVHKLTIWGNHSSTQVPDFTHAEIRGRSAEDTIPDRHWLQETFFKTVQTRGAEVIAARGKSSAASAAQAIIDSIRSLVNPTPINDWFSCGILSDKNPYGIKPGLIFSFPCRLKKPKEVEIVPNLSWDPFIEKKIRQTEQELLEERDMVKELL